MTVTHSTNKGPNVSSLWNSWNSKLESFEDSFLNSLFKCHIPSGHSQSWVFTDSFKICESLCILRLNCEVIYHCTVLTLEFSPLRPEPSLPFSQHRVIWIEGIIFLPEKNRKKNGTYICNAEIYIWRINLCCGSRIWTFPPITHFFLLLHYK